MHTQIIAGVLIVFAVTRSLATGAENWPQWRGPDGNGVAADGDYPVEFSSEKGVAWKVELPGLGSSTPAVWGDHVFVTCEIDGNDGVVCYNFAGEEQWTKELGPGRQGKHKNGSGANPSPVTDGERVVVYYKSGLIAALDFSGKALWDVNLQDEYAKDTLWWDLGTSPVLVDGKAVVAVIQEGESYLVAIDLASGEVAWREPRQYQRPKESDQAYTTPSVVEVDGQRQIVVWGADHLTGHDPATGKRLWQSDGFNPDDKGMWRVIASQAVGDGVAVVPYGRAEFLAAVDITEAAAAGRSNRPYSDRRWKKTSLGADVPTPIIQDGRVLLLGDKGEITKLDLATGNEVWSADLPRHRTKYYASPVLAGDKLYCTREDGVIFVGQVGDEFKLLADNDMGERLIATPIPIRGGLLIRGAEHLFWIE